MIPYINISRKYKYTTKEFKPFKQSHIYHIYTKNKTKKNQQTHYRKQSNIAKKIIKPEHFNCNIFKKIVTARKTLLNIICLQQN